MEIKPEVKTNSISSILTGLLMVFALLAALGGLFKLAQMGTEKAGVGGGILAFIKAPLRWLVA
jgi:hypothetical protein